MKRWTGRAVVGGVCALAAGAAGAQTYDPVADFSTASNPNGVWRYLYSATLSAGYAATLETDNSYAAPFGGWTGAVGADKTPGVLVPTDNAAHNSGTVVIQPDRLHLHPGPGGEFQIVRFVAPIAGVYTISGVSFTPQDANGTSTDVHVIQNATAHLFDGSVTGSAGLAAGVGPAAPILVALVPGDTIDFVVGTGGNGYSYDMTGLRATISVPEPAGLGALALGAVGLRRRRRG